jgi:hypothetical protein
VRVGTPEDEEAKKQVQEAVWTWAVRVLVLAVAFGFGFFAGWVLYGAGPTGAVQLRAQVEDLEAQLLDCKNKRVDSEGKVTVLQGRLDECNRSLAKALSSPASPPPANPQ